MPPAYTGKHAPLTPARQASTRPNYSRRDDRLSWPGWLVIHWDGSHLIVTQLGVKRTSSWL